MVKLGFAVKTCKNLNLTGKADVWEPYEAGIVDAGRPLLLRVSSLCGSTQLLWDPGLFIIQGLSSMASCPFRKSWLSLDFLTGVGASTLTLHEVSLPAFRLYLLEWMCVSVSFLVRGTKDFSYPLILEQPKFLPFELWPFPLENWATHSWGFLWLFPEAVPGFWGQYKVPIHWFCWEVDGPGFHRPPSI